LTKLTDELKALIGDSAVIDDPAQMSAYLKEPRKRFHVPALAVARSLSTGPEPPDLRWLGGHRGLEATISAIAAHGAAFVGANVLHLEGGTRDHFFEFLGREYPHLVDGYQRLYANGAKRVPREYAKAISAKVAELREAIGLMERME